MQYAGEEAVFAMVVNGMMEPHSKRGTPAWMETAYRPEWEDVSCTTCTAVRSRQ